MADQELPGPGHPPTRLDQTVAYRTDEQGVRHAQTVIDRVEETIRQGGFVKDAAARVGVTTQTLNNWRTIGNRCLREVMDGSRRRSEMTKHERLCSQLAARMDTAEADARTFLLAIGNKVARGGWKRTEVTEERDSAGAVVKRVVREIEAAPDTSYLTWLLSHRWPADFGGRQRVEVSGPDGAPLAVDAEPIVDRLRSALDDARANRAETSPEAIEAALSKPSNGHGPNGHDDAS